MQWRPGSRSSTMCDHVFSRIHEGEWLTLDGNKLVNSAGSVIAEGPLHHRDPGGPYRRAHRRLWIQIEAFAENTHCLRVEKSCSRVSAYLTWSL